MRMLSTSLNNALLNTHTSHTDISIFTETETLNIWNVISTFFVKLCQRSRILNHIVNRLILYRCEEFRVMLLWGFSNRLLSSHYCTHFASNMVGCLHNTRAHTTDRPQYTRVNNRVNSTPLNPKYPRTNLSSRSWVEPTIQKRAANKSTPYVESTVAGLKSLFTKTDTSAKSTQNNHNKCVSTINDESDWWCALAQSRSACA